MIVVYKASSLITILDMLSRLKARLDTKTKIAKEVLGNDKDKTTNVFTLTFVKLEEDLSQSILESIS